MRKDEVGAYELITALLTGGEEVLEEGVFIWDGPDVSIGLVGRYSNLCLNASVGYGVGAITLGSLVLSQQGYTISLGVGLNR